MLIKILLGLTAVIVILVCVIVSRPNEFRIVRSIQISAPAEKVFPHVNDFHQWQDWSPWAKLDPNSKVAFEGPSSGNGAIFRWRGNDQVGVGSNTIIESRSNELIRIKLDFLKPFQATNTAEFTFQQQGDVTTVTWSMFGKNNFIGKAMSLVMNCDKMVGGQFEKGLSSLKEVVEK